MAFTRTRFSAQSSASALVISSTPPFAAQYGTDRRSPTCPATEVMLITDPPPFAAIQPPRCLQHRNTPVRFTETMFDQSVQPGLLDAPIDRVDAGVVHQHVDPPMRRQRRVAQRQHVVLARDVGDLRHRVLADRGDRILQRRLGAAGQHHLGTGRRQRLGDAASDAAAAAGHHRDQPGQVERAAHQFGPWRMIFCAMLQRCTSDGPS